VDGRDKPGYDEKFGCSVVMPGLVPGIHAFHYSAQSKRECRDKPGHDEVLSLSFVMPGLVPGIHAFTRSHRTDRAILGFSR